MGSSILDIGTTALMAAQAGIATTSHNISNASTPGYSRQQILQASNLAMKTGYGYLGQGVHVATIQRSYSDFLARQVTDAQSQFSELDAYHTQATQIDNLLADPSAGLAPSMQDFFASVNDLANNPSDMASRQAMLSSTQSLVGKFQTLQTRLDQIGQDTQSQIKSNVDTLNGYAQQIAKLNDAIAVAESAQNNQPANDLRDQRDLLVQDLSKLVQTSVVQQSDGTFNIYIGNGQALVLGNQAASLTATPSQADNSQLQINYQLGGVTSQLKDPSSLGGQLGALLSFKTDMLDAAKNSLGRIALALAGTFNAQNRLGQDLNGAPGGDVFNIAQPSAIANGANTGNASLSVSFSDFGALTTSNYQIGFDGTNYTLTRLSDGTTTTSGSLPMNVDGLNISLSSGSMAAGDSFMLKPTQGGAGAISLAINDPAKIAAAAPIRTSASSANKGTGALSSGSVDSTYPSSPLAGNVTLSFNSATGNLSGFPAGQPITLTVNGSSTVYPAGSSVPFTEGASISFGGMSFTMSGTPANGDQFVISPNTSGVGDNRNALLLAGLQGQDIFGGTASLMDAYGQMVAQVGNKTRELEVNSQAQSSLLQDAQNSQQSVSGVNLDEEAAKLLQYQQAYQAAGKVMQIASQLFNVILSIGN